MRKIRIGILGLGTVGGGLVQLLARERASLRRQFQIDPEVIIVAVKNSKKRRPPEIRKLVPRSILTDNPQRVVQHQDVDLVVEAIGGLSPAYRLTCQALSCEKAVVTANKAVLSRYPEKILRLARQHDSYIGFRAAITGCQSILPHLYAGRGIEGIVGILNGTTNYILTKMTEEGTSFTEALRQAQQLGFAESNPSLDISGRDTADKIAILALLAFGQQVDPETIYTEGISDITPIDIKFAQQFGFVIKLLGIARLNRSAKLDIRVHPALVDKKSPLASISGEENGLYIEDPFFGPGVVTALGAGEFPTASAILSDIVFWTKGRAPDLPQKILPARQQPIANLATPYYLRFTAQNRAGVLSKIAGVLARHKINILSVIQEGGRGRDHTPVPLTIMTDIAREGAIQKALLEMPSLRVLAGRPLLLRIETGL